MADDCHTDYEPGKLFVGGLSWSTNKDTLGAHFSQFGELSDCTVMYDKGNEKDLQPRGFGFVTYKYPEHAELALLSKDHEIDGKMVDPKKASKNGQPTPKLKVFVGGLPTDADEMEIATAMSSFGGVADNGVEIKFDRTTRKSRGFGFVTFKNEADAVCAIGKHYIQVKGKTVEIKKAENNKKTKGGRGAFSGGGYTPYGGGGSASGGYDYQASAYASTQQQHSGQQPYAYGSGYSAYTPQQWSYDQYTGGAAGGTANYYSQQQGSTAANYSTGSYGNGYNSSRSEAPPQSYSYPQQQQAYSYQGYGGSGGGRSQVTTQQGYSNSFPGHQ